MKEIETDMRRHDRTLSLTTTSRVVERVVAVEAAVAAVAAVAEDKLAVEVADRAAGSSYLRRAGAVDVVQFVAGTSIYCTMIAAVIRLTSRNLAL